MTISRLMCPAERALLRRCQCALQGFLDRMHNFLHYLLMKVVVMSDKSSAEHELSTRFGYDADGQWARKSTAAALIASGDWGFEHPLPVPPKVHVRLFSRYIRPFLGLPRKLPVSSYTTHGEHHVAKRDDTRDRLGQGCFPLLISES